MDARLSKAISEQRTRDELIKAYSKRAREYRRLGDHLRRRLPITQTAYAHLAGEIEDSMLDEFIRHQLRDRFRYLLHIIDPALRVRIMASQLLARLAQVGHAGGRPPTSIIDGCLA